MTFELEQQKQLYSNLAFTSFLVLYPIFHWYHTALAFGMVPEFIFGILKGLYGPVCFVTLFAYLYSFSRSSRLWSCLSDDIFLAYIAYILWSVFWLSFNASFLHFEHTHQTALTLLQDLILQTANFAIGTLLLIRKGRFGFLILVIFWVSIALFNTLAFDPMFDSVYHRLVNDPAIVSLRDGPVSFASYQGMARSFVMTAFLLIAMIERYGARLVVTAISCVTLFIIGARSELAGFVFALATLELFSLRKTPALILGNGALAIILLSCCAWFWPELSARLNNARMLSLFELQHDVSWRTRIDQISDALQTIVNSPIFGEFGAHQVKGNSGDIPHNILSAWTTLGLPGFLLVCFLVGKSFITSAKKAANAENLSPQWRFALLTTAMSVPLLLVAKSAFVEWLALAFGATVAARISDREI